MAAFRLLAIYVGRYYLLHTLFSYNMKREEKSRRKEKRGEEGNEEGKKHYFPTKASIHDVIHERLQLLLYNFKSHKAL